MRVDLNTVAVASVLVAFAFVVACLTLVLIRTSTPRPRPRARGGGLAAALPPSGGLAALTDPRAASIVPGVIWEAVSDASPYLLVEAYIDGVFVRIRASTTYAGLYVPGRVNDVVAFELVVASLESGCSKERARYTGSRARFGRVTVTQRPPWISQAQDQAVVGLAPQRRGVAYISPVLETLRLLRKPIVWAFNVAHRPQTYLSLAIPVAPCFQWCWSPMDTSTGLYVIALLPSSDAPWTEAVLDLGHWQTVLPSTSAATAARTRTPSPVSTNTDITSIASSVGSSDSGNTGVLLATPSGCTFFIRPGTYRVDSSPGARCVLGISAGLSGGALAVDVSDSRLGYVAVTPVTVL